MLKPIKRFTNIKVVTWPGVAAKIDLDRYYEIYDCDTNELILKGVSKWLLMDITTRHIVRANSISYPIDVCEKVLYDSFDKLRFDDLEFDYFNVTKYLCKRRCDRKGHTAFCYSYGYLFAFASAM